MLKADFKNIQGTVLMEDNTFYLTTKELGDKLV